MRSYLAQLLCFIFAALLLMAVAGIAGVVKSNVNNAQHDNISIEVINNKMLQSNKNLLKINDDLLELNEQNQKTIANCLVQIRELLEMNERLVQRVKILEDK